MFGSNITFDMEIPTTSVVTYDVEVSLLVVTENSTYLLNVDRDDDGFLIGDVTCLSGTLSHRVRNVVFTMVGIKSVQGYYPVFDAVLEALALASRGDMMSANQVFVDNIVGHDLVLHNVARHGDQPVLDSTTVRGGFWCLRAAACAGHDH